MHKKFKDKIKFDILELNLNDTYKIISKGEGITEVLIDYCKNNLENKHIDNVLRVTKALNRNLNLACYKLYKLLHSENESISNDIFPKMYEDCGFIFDDD